MDALVKQWVARAEYDLKTGEALYESGRYLYVAFMCQQSIEKLLKAFIAASGENPPFLHNLVRLAEDAKLLNTMPENIRFLLADLNPYYIKARYGEYKESLAEVCNKAKANAFLKGAKEFFLWLNQELK